MDGGYNGVTVDNLNTMYFYRVINEASVNVKQAMSCVLLEQYVLPYRQHHLYIKSR